MQSGYDIGHLVQEAQTRWLKPPEVLFILQNHESHQITQEPPQKPPSGSLFLFNKRVLRFFRKDGHSWRKKKDGRTVGEAHERLKVGNVEALNCYYAHGEKNPSFQRRSYWMLDPAYDHIVLVHYREITDAKLSFGSISELSPGPSSTFSQSPTSCILQNPGSTSLSDVQDPYQNLSSPGSTEVSSEVVIKDNRILHYDRVERTGNLSTSSHIEVSQALRRLEEQLSLDDDTLKDYEPIYHQDENEDGHVGLYDNNEVLENYQSANLQHNHFYRGHTEILSGSSNHALQPHSGDNGMQPLSQDYGVENKESLSWNDALGLTNGSFSEQRFVTNRNDKQLASSAGSTRELENQQLWDSGENKTGKSYMLSPQEAEIFSVPLYSFATSSCNTKQDYYSVLLDRSQFGMPFEVDSSLTIPQEQKFTIREISPEWGFANEATKVIIIGSFLCDPSDCTWTCMFGDIEVPMQMIQDGVLCCQAPPHLPGKVTLCISLGNRQSCSEIREFEYRDKGSICAYCNKPRREATRSTEELLLLVRFVQMLLSNSSMQKGDSSDLEIDHLLSKLKSDEDSWGQIIEALLVGSGNSSDTMEWLLQQLLKDKLQQWLSSRSQREYDLECSLSRKEQGIIHMIAGLGYQWALNPILGSGVGINFRDINGWTALHWAARFGREKMVAALIASGASAGAVTDPRAQDPIGKTPASIAAARGYKGLAGYLSELALTSHLSSLTLEESELSKGSANVQAEITVNNISRDNVASSEEQLSLKHTLAAVRNAAQAAARIQAAFRAHSFRKRQQQEAVVAANSFDEYGLSLDEISAASKLVFRNLHDDNKAALSIQKNYRGWKGRKDFLSLRQKVVKIQAHVRGHQVRKKYICWAVGILDKVVLRWRRKGVGLRGYKPDSDVIDENEEYEDILKGFRKQKVDVALGEAVSSVLSMVDSPQARQQYQRMLDRYQEAKAELGVTTGDAASTSQGDLTSINSDFGMISNMSSEDVFQLL